MKNGGHSLREILRATALCAALTAPTGCRTVATEVELFIDSDVAADRPVTLRILSFKGNVSSDEIAARAVALGTQNELVLRRNGGAMSTLVLGGSIGVLPAEAGLEGGVTLWLRATFGATATAPEVPIDRVAHLSFVPQRRGTARIYLALSCGDLALGCTSVSAGQCTVSVRCREQGATCGDNGECVTPEVAVTLPGQDAAMDSIGVDATTMRADSGAVDAMDAMDGISGGDSGDGGPIDPSIEPPLPLFPQSVSVISTMNPDFRWRFSAPTDGATLMICRDRACTQELATMEVSNTHLTRGVDLPPRTVVYWRLRGKRGNVHGTRWSATWEFLTPSVSAPRAGGTFVRLFADYNGDRLSDVAVGNSRGNAQLYYGRNGALDPATGVALAPMVNGFAWSVATAGDVNGDGFGDLIVGSPNARDLGVAPVGLASIYLGSAQGIRMPPIEIPGSTPDGFFGFAVKGLGDVNGDGYGDFAVGADHEPLMGVINVGAAFVYYGNAMASFGSPTVVRGRDRTGDFARSIACAGDLNGDGFADVAIGSGGYNRVHVFHGGAMGISTTPTIELTGNSPGDLFGFAVDGAGDVNGDGFADLLVGSPNGGASGLGAVYTGSASGIQLLNSAALPGQAVGDQHGISVACAGDFDGDGADEVAVGSIAATIAGRPNAGRVLVYSALRPLATPVLFRIVANIEGTEADAHLGESLASSPDCDGDGSVDFLVGVPASSRVQMFGGELLRYSVAGAIMDGAPPTQRLMESWPNGYFGFTVAQMGWGRIGLMSRRYVACLL